MIRYRFKISYLMQKCVLATALIFLFISWTMAAPLPWVISNLDPDGRSDFLNDQNGELITNDFLVQLILDSGGNGPDQPDEFGNPMGDDQLVSSWISRPDGEVIPSGSFILMTSLDSEDPRIVDQMMFYIRAYSDTLLVNETYFADSQLFPGPDPVNGTQVIIDLPDQMFSSLSNQAPQITVDPTTLTVPAGSEAVVEVSALDDALNLDFYVDTENLPGGSESVTVSKTSDTTATVSWIVPFDATGAVRNLICFVSDGTYRSSDTVFVAVNPPDHAPMAFHLESPKDTENLWENIGFSWNASQDIDGGDIFYVLYWADNEEFADADSVTGLVETSVIVTFDGNLLNNGITNQSGINKYSVINKSLANQENNDFEMAGVQSSASKTISTQMTGLRTRGSIQEISLNGEIKNQTIINSAVSDFDMSQKQLPFPDEIVIPVNLDQGDMIFWKVRAYDSNGASTWSSETWQAYAESPDAPSGFNLEAPENGAELQTLSPVLSWGRAMDPDRNDDVLYNILYSFDEWVTSDTIFGIDGREYCFDSPEIQGVDGSNRFRDNLFQALLTKDSELDELPDEVTVYWTVEAVDNMGLRGPAMDIWQFSISVPSGPDAFALASPANRRVFEHFEDVVLIWTPSTDNDENEEVRYTLYGTNDQELTPDEFPVIADDLTSISYILETGEIVDDMIWRWRVKSTSGEDELWACAGDEGYYSFAFSNPGRPEHFGLLTPADQETVPTINPVFSWEEPVDTDPFEVLSYTLFWSFDNWETLDSLTGISETTFQMEDVLTNQAITVNQDNLQILPDNKINLDGNSDNFESMQSSTTSNAEEILKSAAFSELDEFRDNSQVWWKIRCQDSNSEGRWASPLNGWTFNIYVEDPPELFNLLEPENNYELVDADTSLFFDWQDSEDPDGLEGLNYILYLSDNNEFTDYDSILVNDSELEISRSEFVAYTDYFWYVIAEDAAQSQRKSRQTWHFYVPMAAPQSQIAEIPTELDISATYPNPFNPSVTLEVAIPEKGLFDLRVYDILGREITKIGSQEFTAGYHKFNLDMTGKPSGSYFLQFQGTKGKIVQRRVIMVK